VGGTREIVHNLMRGGGEDRLESKKTKEGETSEGDWGKTSRKERQDRGGAAIGKNVRRIFRSEFASKREVIIKR